MKKFATFLLALSALTAAAEGYQVNTFSAKQEGMGHVGAAMLLGSESIIFNPGALGFSTHAFEVSGAVSTIMATANCWHKDIKYTTDNKVSTPMNISASFRVYDNLYAGISIYTPYGSSINWGENWAGAVLNQSVDLKVFTVQPTISWRVNDNISLGAGLMLSWGNVNLNKGLVSPSSMDALMVAMQQPIRFNGVTPASVNLNGSSSVACGVNVGALWKISDRVNVGLDFRSKMQMKVKKGNASVSYANEQAQALLGNALDLLNSTNFSSAMPCPYVLTAGIAYQPVERLTLAFDAQLTGWKTYKILDFSFDNLPDYDQHLVKNYKNAMTYHLGAQYALTQRLDLRAGLMIDTSPCNKKHYNPETPGATKIEPSVGFSFRPIKGLSVDIAFMYVSGQKVKNAEGQYEDFIAKKFPMLNMPVEGSFTADYKVKAVIPAIGISYSF